MSLYDMFCVIGSQVEVRFNLAARPQAGPLESVFLATALSTLLPKSIHSLIKDIPTFTNFKLLDDSTWIFDLFSYIVTLPYKMCELLLPKTEKTQSIFSALRIVEDFLPFSSLSKYHYEMKIVLDEYAAKMSIVGDKAFQDRVVGFNARYAKYRFIFLEDRKELPPYMLDHDKRFKNLLNKVNYMKSNIRVEPVACIFNGKRGTGKTTLMNMIAQGYAVQNSVYYHTSQEDKDFHDQYDNEDLYVIDDIGQKGAWQWGGMINFVSTSKNPLVCAEAEKKGTKFFTSRLILASTNNINITLTANCGITDIGALHRRLINMDFDQITFHEGKFAGRIIVKDYSLQQNRWIETAGFDATDGAFDMMEIAVFLNERMAKKKANMQIFSKVTDFGAIPQSLTVTEAVYKVANYVDRIPKSTLFGASVIAGAAVGAVCTPDLYMPTVSKIVSYFRGLFRDFSEMPLSMQDMWSDSINGAGSLLAKASSVELHTKVIATSVALTMAYGIYKCFDLLTDDSEDVPKESKALHYKAQRKERIKMMAAMPQSLSRLFRDVDCAVDIPALTRIKNHMVVVEANFVNRDNKNTTTFSSSVISGRYFTLPLHALNLEVGDIATFTIYTSPVTIQYDKIECEVAYVNYKDDIAIVILPLCLPKYFGNVNFVADTNVTEVVLCTPGGVVDLETRVTSMDCRVTYKAFNTGYLGTLTDETSMLYEEQQDGSCGSLLLTKDGFLLGHHVAAVSTNSPDAQEFGCAKLFSQKTIRKIRELFDERVDYAVQMSKSMTEGSITRIDAKVFSTTPNRTSYVPSLVNGIFEITRAPANLAVYGEDTLKIMSQRNGYRKVEAVDNHALAYAEEYIDGFLPTVGVLKSEKEVVLGNGNIGRIDPKTSVGHGLKGEKSEYLDFENGLIKPVMKEKVQQFCDEVTAGTYKFDTYYTETLKDELKNVAKVDSPRVFKAGPLMLTLMYRFFFGEMMGRVSDERLTNGIMVGINPLGFEWERFAKAMLSFSPHFFDGDWKWWDIGMLTQAQQRALKKLKSKVFRPAHYLIFNSVFGTFLDSVQYERVWDMCAVLLYMTPTITGRSAFITTHSMPSGCAVTAFFNSLVNKLYGPYIFYVLHMRKFGIPPKTNMYRENVRDFVYGDDKVTAVKEAVKNWYNGPAFATVAREMGLDFTPADKGAWQYETRSLFDCGFLKRGFYFHTRLGKIVAPLEVVSMQGTLNFVSDGFRNEELSIVKVQNFQREAFLHEHQYEGMMRHVKQFVASRGLVVDYLSEEYLVKLYLQDDYGDYLRLT
jgi:hypothetical protein